MYVNPYANSAPYELRKHVDDIREKMKSELEKPAPDLKKLNKLREAMFMPDIFSQTYMGGYERFRSPW